MTNITLILRLLFAHFLGDFMFQTKTIVDDKNRKNWKSPWLFFHCFFYSLLVYAAVGVWRYFYLVIPFVFVTHFVIDGWKSTLEDKPQYFIADQVLHLLVLAGVFCLCGQEAGPFLRDILTKVWTSQAFLGVIGGFVMVTLPFGRLVGCLTKNFREKLDTLDFKGLPDAGLWIGCLERLLIYSFILADYPEAIALLVGAKSLFRFGDIKDSAKRAQTEYILVGTMLSFGLAMASGFAVKKLFLG
ncbi:MAG: DUF3307 domain-containing protein [Candidatus Aminicenantes bacterium]|nr:DUF3307 domain-containing protein [Candidatus Aminicenantes bacterium]